MSDADSLCRPTEDGVAKEAHEKATSILSSTLAHNLLNFVEYEKEESKLIWFIKIVENHKYSNPFFQ